MKKLLVILCCIYSIVAQAQFKEYDFVSSLKEPEPPVKIFYLTGTWCSPCMEKLPKIMKEFENRHDSLVIVFDRNGLTPPIVTKLAGLYDTSRFHEIPYKYYASKKKYFFINIKVNPQFDGMKNLITDINKNFGTSYKMKNFWFGDLVIFKNHKFHIIDDYDKDSFSAEVDKILAGK